MKKVAVFGNAGGGKSTLSQRLSEITGLPLYILDKLQYQAGGAEVPPDHFKRIHQEILETDQWIIDGFGSIDTLWPRLDQADTLVYIDLPLYVHFGLVTKRLITGYFKPPEGWPENSPIFKSSLNSYRVLRLCHQHLTPKYREYVEQAARDGEAQAHSSKRVYHLRSIEQSSQFLAAVKHETGLQATDGA